MRYALARVQVHVAPWLSLFVPQVCWLVLELIKKFIAVADVDVVVFSHDTHVKARALQRPLHVVVEHTPVS